MRQRVYSSIFRSTVSISEGGKVDKELFIHCCIYHQTPGCNNLFFNLKSSMWYTAAFSETKLTFMHSFVSSVNKREINMVKKTTTSSHDDKTTFQFGGICSIYWHNNTVLRHEWIFLGEFLPFTHMQLSFDASNADCDNCT